MVLMDKKRQESSSLVDSYNQKLHKDLQMVIVDKEMAQNLPYMLHLIPSFYLNQII